MSPAKPFKVLVFSKTVGYRHESIPDGIAGIEKLGETTGAFTVDATEDASVIEAHNLARYTAVIFLQTSGDFLIPEQVSALQTYMHQGGGFVGIHCASAGMTEDPWYGELVGAVFVGHPDPQEATVKLEANNRDHTIVAGMPETWDWHDEWYNFRANPRGKVDVLITVDESTYTGGKMGTDHPLAWCRNFEGGRSFYTALGHFGEAYRNVSFMSHIRSGIFWAAGIDQ